MQRATFAQTKIQPPRFGAGLIERGELERRMGAALTTEEDALDLSPHTVKRHVARILDRLDLSSRGEAAAWYQEHCRA